MSNYEIHLTAIEHDLDGNGNRWLDDVTLVVSASSVPYMRATYVSPAEGGFFDDIEIVKIVEVLDGDGEDITLEEVSLGARLWGYASPSLLDVLRDALDDALYNQDGSVQEQLAEENNSRKEAAEQDYYDAKFETFRLNE